MKTDKTMTLDEIDAEIAILESGLKELGQSILDAWSRPYSEVSSLVATGQKRARDTKARLKKLAQMRADAQKEMTD